jgi:ribose transport system substrate-binding protein
VIHIRPARHWARAPLTVALGVTAALALAACGSSGSSGSASASSSAAKHYTIAYVPGATGVSFYDTLVDGMRTQAKTMGMSVIYQGSPNFDPSDQTPVVEAVCSRHPNVLVVSPTDPTAMAPAINTCLNAGIPVITTDTQLANTSKLTSQITTNNIQGGKLAAAYLGKQLHGSGQIAVLSLSPTATTQVQRVQGLENALKASYPNIKVVTLQYTAQAVTSSQTVVRSILAAHPGIKAIFGAAEPNAEGAAAALAADGKTGKVLVVGFDAGPTEVALLKQGKVSALIAQQAAKEGSLAAQYAHDKLTGQASAITASVQLPDVLLTSADVSEPSIQKYFYAP